MALAGTLTLFGVIHSPLLGNQLFVPWGPESWGSVVLDPANRRDVFDRRFVVLHARSVDGDRPVGTLLHMACHPEVLPRRLKFNSLT